MNHVYRLVWNPTLQALVAVCESARGRGKSGSTVKTTGALLTSVLLSTGATLALAAGPAPGTLPTGAQVTAGSASISSTANTLTVQQSTQKAAINWQSFSVGSGATVNFVQPNASSVVLNRVVGTEQSVIAGAMNANGQVFLLNSNGVLFTGTASVNVGGLVASTLNLSDADFKAGRNTFSANGSKASVINLGTINAADGGYVALLGNQVKNEGVITARLGTAILAAGDQISLNFNGDSLVGVSIDQGTLNALVENKQAIYADGGLVVLTAKGLDAVMATVVNNTGEIRAQTVANKEGKIYLLGGMDNNRIEVGGTLDASAPNGGNGGFVETSAAKVKIADSVAITTAAANGQQGQWLIDPEDFTIAASSGDITGAALATLLLTNNVTIETATGSNTATNLYGTVGTNGDIFVNDAVNMAASSARHSLTLKAYRNIVFQSVNGSTIFTASGIDATTSSNTQALDIVLWANEGGLGGNISLGHQAYIRSNGGNIWLGGGTAFFPTTWNGLTVGGGFAKGYLGSTNGITLNSGSFLDAGAGAISMRASNYTGGKAVLVDFDNSYGNATLRALGGLDLSVQTGDVYSAAGIINIGSASSSSTFNIGAANNLRMTVGGAPSTVTVNGTVQIVSANNVSISAMNGDLTANSSNIVLDASDIAGNFSLYAGASITQTGALNVAGTATFVGMSGVALTNSGNTIFGAVSGGTTAGAFSLTNARDLVIDRMDVTGGNISLTADGNITSFNPGGTSSFSVTGLGYSTILNAGSTHDINLDTGGYPMNRAGGNVVISAARNVTLVDRYDTSSAAPTLTLGASNISGNLLLKINSNGGYSVNQNGALNVAGTTTVQAIDSGNALTVNQAVPLSVVFDNTSNVFGGAVSVTGHNATIKASTDLKIGVMDVDSLLAVAGTGKNVEQLGNITTHAGNAVLVADSANNGIYTNTSGSISTTGGNYYIYSHDPDGTTLGSLSPAFFRFGDTYYSYPPGGVTESGSGIIYASNPTSPIYLRLTGGGSSVYGSTPTFGYAYYTTAGGSTAVTDASPAGTVTWSSAPTASSNAGIYSLTYSSGITLGNSAYTLSPGSAVSWTVSPAPLTVTASNASKVYGQIPNLSSFTSLGLVNSETIGSVTETSSGTAVTAGVAAGPYAIVASAATGGSFAPGNYSISYVNGSLTVTPLVIAVAANNGATRVYDGSANAAASLLHVANAINGDTVTLSGNATLAAGSAGAEGVSSIAGLTLSNPNYTVEGGSASGSVAVSPAPLTVTASNASKVYGQTPTLNGFTSSGLIEGETIGSVTETSSGTAVTAGVAAGPYAIVASAATGGSFAPGNYSISYVNGALTVTPLVITVAANNGATRVYDGGANVAASLLHVANAINGDTVTLSGSATLAGSNAGAEGVSSIAGLTLSNPNYTVEGGSASGSVAVSAAPLTVTASNTSKVYGQTPILNGFTSSGLVNSETIGSVTETSSGTAVTAGVTVSPYSIVASAATGGTFAPGNYSISYVNGSLTVTPLVIAVAANNGATRVYDGSANVAASLLHVANAINGDTVTLSGNATLAAGSAGAEGVSSIAGLSLSNPNYTVEGGSASGSVAVSAAPLTVTASNASKVYGQTPILNGFTSSGLVNSETIGSVTETSSGTAVTAGVAAGPYAVVAGAATGGSFAPGNYSISYVNGKLMVTPLAVNVAAVSGATRVFDGSTGAAASLLQVTNAINGDTVTLSGDADLASGAPGAAALSSIASLSVSNPNYTVAGASASGSVTITAAAPSSTDRSASTLVNAIANAVNIPETIQRPSLDLPGVLLPAGGNSTNAGQPSAFVNVTNPLPSISATFGPGERFAVVSSPSANEPTLGVTLSQARAMMQGPGQSGGGASDAVRDVRVPVSRNSLADIVNGGVRLPTGVEQELFVVQAN